MGECLEIAKVMVQPAMKLLEMCGNAIGTVYEPRHMRKMTDAEVYRIKQLGNAISETDSLPIEYENGKISMNTFNLEDFAKRAELRANYQMLREQNNIESVVGKAYQELLDSPEVPSDPVDEDWTTRFFNIVKEINTEEMQFIWSKILAGEITQPGSFSKRTLETIRNLSKNEAVVFQKIIPFIINWGNNLFVSCDDELNKKYSIYFADILLLGECGLMEVNSVSFMPMLKQGDSRNMYTDNRIAIVSGVTEIPSKVSIYTYKLTNAGKELFAILEHKPNNSYFEDFCESVFKKNRNKARITVHEVISNTQEGIRYNTTALSVFEDIKEKQV